MPTTRNPLSLADTTIGRVAIFRAPWTDDPTGILDRLEHIGYTEGEVSPNGNDTYHSFKLAEETGALPLRRFIVNGEPVAQFNVLVGNKTLLADFSPDGNASIGTTRRQEVTYWTFWFLPELALPDRDSIIDYDGTNWLIDGVAANDEQLRLIGVSQWWWKADVTRAMPIYRFGGDGDAASALRQVEIHANADLTKPEGEIAITTGDPADAGIDITAGV